MIETTSIAVNRYAPEGCNSINLYSTGADGGGDLTLGQLAIAVSIRSAAAFESQSVVKMNETTRGSQTLTTAADWLEKILGGTADTTDWAAAKAFAVEELGVEASALPADIESYDNRMKAASAMKAKMDILTQSQQQAMIDLQTLVNRRDVAYSTSSNIVRALGTSLSGNAENL